MKTTGLLFLLLFTAITLHAQPVPGVPSTTSARSGQSELFGEDGDPWTVNDTAWQDARDFSLKSIGVGMPVTLYPVIDFESELNWRGKKMATQTFIPKLGTETYLFGGQAYLDFNWILPVEGDYAKAFNIYMGWCYQITRYLDIDIGGNIFFYDKPVYGFGQTGFGTKDSNDLHIGLSLDVPLNPWGWVTYDFVYEAFIFEGGVRHYEDLATWTGIERLGLNMGITAGWVHADRYSGRANINGVYWENQYSYLFTYADVVYRPVEDLSVAVGVRWSGNNDGSGVASNGAWIGPDSSVWFGMTLTYQWDL